MFAPPLNGRSSLFRFVPSQESMLSGAKQPQPTIIHLSVFLILFLALVFGTSSVMFGDQLLGIVIYAVAAVAAVLLYIGGRLMARWWDNSIASLVGGSGPQSARLSFSTVFSQP